MLPSYPVVNMDSGDLNPGLCVCPAGVLPPSSSVFRSLLRRTLLLPVQLLGNLGLRGFRNLTHVTQQDTGSLDQACPSTWNLSLPPAYSDQTAAWTETPGPPEQLTAHSGAPHL